MPEAGAGAAALRLAAHIGLHAPAWYGAGLALLLACAAALHALAGRRRARCAGAPCACAAFLALLAVLLACAVFATIASGFERGSGLVAFDVRLARTLDQALPPAFAAVFAVLTHAGDTLTITLLAIVVAVLLWLRGERALALPWVLAIGGNALLNVGLKAFFARARPPFDASLASAAGWSFPSGHASGTLVACGMLAFLAHRLLPPRWRLAALLAAVALAYSVGTSRVLLRVHYFSDVLAGFCSGLAWLLLCLALWRCALDARG